MENTSTISVFILWLFVQAVSSEIKSSVVMNCANTTEGYEEAAKLWNCTGTLTYHCVLDIEDNFRELCIHIAAIGYGYCPKLQKANTTTGYTFEWKPCTEELELLCPKRTSTIYSNEVYKFSGCLHSSKKKSSELLSPTDLTILTDTTTTTSPPGGESAGVLGNATADVSRDANGGVSGGVIAGVVILVVFVVIVALLCYRSRTGKLGNTTEYTFIPLPIKRSLQRRSGHSIGLAVQVKVTDYKAQCPSVSAPTGQIEEKTNGIIEKCKEVLDKGQNLVCIGALGSGKTTILRRLAVMFKKEWNILKFEDLEQFKDSKKKYIWILDDIFGNLNYINNENRIKDDIQKVETIVKMCDTNRFKMVLSIRQDILRYVKEKLRKIGLTIDADINCVYIDSTTDDFANQIAIETSKCTNLNCCCSKASTCAGNLGQALILDMLCKIKHTDLFHEDVRNWNPLQALIKIFDRMLNNEEEDTTNRSFGHVLIYIMLKGEYNPKKFDKQCAREIHENLNKFLIDAILKDENAYITSLEDDSRRQHFRHEFYHIAVFHTCWKWRKELIIKFCSTDFILQLCRIDDHGLDLEIVLVGEDLQAVNDRLQREDLTGIERPRTADMPSVSA